MLLNRMLATAMLSAIAASLTSRVAQAKDTIGVTATEIKVGTTFPFSGPASVLGNVGKSLIGYVNYINDRGGVTGRNINLIALDHAYTPSKSVELNRRLVEGDEVAFLFSPLGTASISAVLKYANNRKVPHLFVVSPSLVLPEFRSTQAPKTTRPGRLFNSSSSTAPPRF